MYVFTGRFSSTVSVGLVLALTSIVAPRTAHAQTSVVSIAMDGTTLGNDVSDSPSLSADGRFVAFASRATNLVANDTNSSQDVFVRDRLLQVTTRISVTSAGEERSGNSHHPFISADGATHGAFDLFYLLQNASSTEAHGTVRYLRLAPATPIVKVYSVPANGRLTIYVDTEDPGLAAVDVGATITSDQPIIVERAMYASTPTQPFAAGHEGAGVAAPALTWFLAEGATGAFFDEYVLVANPNTAPAQLTVSYLLPDGVRFSKPYTVAAESRLTISVDGEDPRLADTAVSVIVESTNSQPVVVERAMWWPSPNWYEAHLSAGATTTGTRWALAGGEVNTSVTAPNEGVETYVLIANTSASAGTATVTVVACRTIHSFPRTRRHPWYGPWTYRRTVV